MKDHRPLDEPPQTPTDEGLRCPACEYNLTGLVDEVCPECGEAFNRAQLLARLKEATGPIPEWSRRYEVGLVRAFLATLIEMWFFPMRFGRRFPRNPELKGPRLFGRICLGVSFALGLLAFAFGARGGLDAAFVFVVICIAVPVGVVVCEYMLAGALLSPADDDEMEGEAYDSGIALVRMGRSFLVLNSAVTSGYAASVRLIPTVWYLDLSWLYVAAGVFVYWWVCMVLIAAGHPRRRTAIFNTIIAIPFSAGFALFAVGCSVFIVAMMIGAIWF